MSRPAYVPRYTMAGLAAIKQPLPSATAVRSNLTKSAWAGGVEEEEEEEEEEEVVLVVAADVDERSEVGSAMFV